MLLRLGEKIQQQQSMNEVGTINLNNKWEYTRCVLPDLGAALRTNEEIEEEVTGIILERKPLKLERLKRLKEEHKKKDEDENLKRKQNGVLDGWINRNRKRQKLEKVNVWSMDDESVTLGLEYLFQLDGKQRGTVKTEMNTGSIKWIWGGADL